MRYFIDKDQEKEIARAIDTVDVSTPRQRNAVVFRTEGEPFVVIISNYPNAHGHSLSPGDAVEELGIVIYAPGPFDLEEEIKKVYPSECDFNDVLFMYTEKYHSLKFRYLKEFRQPEHIRQIVQRALDDECTFINEPDSEE